VTRRSYEQACTLARTLDVVGERWTLLLIRELMLGPKRFTDLLDGLPGIGRNLLAARLRHLETEGIVEKGQLPPPAASQVYELTEDGRALGPAMAELGRWGVERLDRPPRRYLFRPGWAVFPLAYMADTKAARGVHETYEFRIDGETFNLRVADGEVEPRDGAAQHPDLVVTMDARTLRELFLEDLSAVEGLTSGRIAVEGAPEVLGRAMAILAGGPG
jgi:DNA-binding HxlR family transcriptional regulator